MGEAVGFQRFKMRLFKVWETSDWVKIECFHRVANPESERLRVAALNLFYPTAPPLSRRAVFSYYNTVSQGGGWEGDGDLPDWE